MNHVKCVIALSIQAPDSFGQGCLKPGSQIGIRQEKLFPHPEVEGD
jgi:hypothetical protein